MNPRQLLRKLPPLEAANAKPAGPEASHDLQALRLWGAGLVEVFTTFGRADELAEVHAILADLDDEFGPLPAAQAGQ